MIEELGQWTIKTIGNTGRFSRFAWASYGAMGRTLFKPKDYSRILTQMHAIGVKSVPVVMATVAFVGMILALQSYDQLANMGLQ